MAFQIRDGLIRISHVLSILHKIRISFCKSNYFKDSRFFYEIQFDKNAHTDTHVTLFLTLPSKRIYLTSGFPTIFIIDRERGRDRITLVQKKYVPFENQNCISLLPSSLFCVINFITSFI